MTGVINVVVVDFQQTDIRRPPMMGHKVVIRYHALGTSTNKPVPLSL
jgi:hypothetical protein